MKWYRFRSTKIGHSTVRTPQRDVGRVGTVVPSKVPREQPLLRRSKQNLCQDKLVKIMKILNELLSGKKCIERTIPTEEDRGEVGRDRGDTCVPLGVRTEKTLTAGVELIP